MLSDCLEKILKTKFKNYKKIQLLEQLKEIKILNWKPVKILNHYSDQISKFPNFQNLENFILKHNMPY